MVPLPHDLKLTPKQRTALRGKANLVRTLAAAPYMGSGNYNIVLRFSAQFVLKIMRLSKST